MPAGYGVSHKSKHGGVRVQLTDCLRECLHLCVTSHNFLAQKKFTRRDLGLGAFGELEKTLDAPSPLGAIKRYNCAVCIATVRVHPQRMPARAGWGR